MSNSEVYQTQLIQYLEGFVNDRRKEKLKKVLTQRTRHLTVVLEDVYQSHNFSAVLRSADIFGIQNIHFIENRNYLKISEDVAMGAQKWLTIERYKQHENNTLACLQKLKKEGYQIVATSVAPTSINLEDLNIDKPTALVFDTELTGISKDVENMADTFVTIPMVGFTESFNISVTVALCLYELSKKLKNNKSNYSITDIDKQMIYQNWLLASIQNPQSILKTFESVTSKME